MLLVVVVVKDVGREGVDETEPTMLSLHDAVLEMFEPIADRR